VCTMFGAQALYAPVLTLVASCEKMYCGPCSDVLAALAHTLIAKRPPSAWPGLSSVIAPCAQCTPQLRFCMSTVNGSMAGRETIVRWAASAAEPPLA